MSRIPDGPLPATGTGGAGRPRDDSIDERVLEVARRHLASVGYESLSIAAVAAEAGTTRAAIYRRWVDKADLATAAIAALQDAAPRPAGNDPFADLVGELAAFHRGVRRPDGLPMVGAMLVGSTEPRLVEQYRSRVVAPRRRRLRSALERARSAGLIDAQADLDVAVTMLTGSWYAAALAGERPPSRWPERTAALVWRACGGAPPSDGARRADQAR